MAKKKVQPQVAKRRRLQIILAVALVAVLGFMTIGFAGYGQILDTSGSILVQPQGTVRITNVEYLGGDHSTGSPTFSDTSIDFGLTFTRGNVGNGDVFTATYRITIKNDTFYNQVFAIPDYSPVIRDSNNNVISDAELGYRLDGIANGDSIPTGATKTFNIVFTFAPTTDGNYTIDGDADVEFSDEQTGKMFASISGTTTGDLRGDNTCANFTVSVINTFDYARDFTFSLVNNSNFTISNGARNIAANTTQNYTVSVCETNPDTQYANSYERANIYVNSAGITSINAGRITLLVDQAVVIHDEDAPVVSGLTATRQTDEGNVLLTWNAEDESTISHFTVLVYNNNNRLLNTFNTSDDETSYMVTGLSDGSYYFKVYGTDAAGNTATQAEINSATTSSGHATRSSTTTFTWNFTITYNLTRVVSTNTASTIKLGQTYSTTLRGKNGNNSHPQTVTITMGGSRLSNSAFTYNSDTGALTIPNVTGNLNISASINNGCLVEGSLIELWDGSQKKVEDIAYSDLLKVWSFEQGKFVAEYPIWIETPAQSDEYQVATLSDGTQLKTVLDHSVFSVDSNTFVSVLDRQNFHVGTKILKEQNGKLVPVRVEKIETIHKPVNYYFIASTRYWNVLAENVLTTDGLTILSNIYGFTGGVRWPENRQTVLYDYAEVSDVLPNYLFVGLRAAEAKILNNYGYTTEQFKDYLNDGIANTCRIVKPTQLLGKNLWTVSIDTNRGLAQTQIIEGGKITLPNDAKTSAWRNSVDGKIYHSGDTVTIYAGTHFAAE